MLFREGVWVSWERQRRSIELAKALGCVPLIFEEKGLLRYPLSFIRTIYFFVLRKPSIIFSQNPSMILAAFVCCWGALFKVPVVVDRHTTFFLDGGERGRLYMYIFGVLNRFTLRKASLTIVTNKQLAGIVAQEGGTPFILPDKLPELNKDKDPGEWQHLEDDNIFNIVLISSFAADEPVAEVVDAVKKLDHVKARLFITGNKEKCGAAVRDSATSNIIFTDFLPDEKFENLVSSVDCIIVLTKLKCCMLCGCYEAVAAGKPLITSNQDALVDYFSGAFFVDNSVEQITSAIEAVMSNPSLYKKKISELKVRLTKSWGKQFQELCSELNNLERGG